MGDRLTGKVALVVGGATGFGLATVKRFTEEGATVVIAGRRLELAKEVAAAHGATATQCDVTDDASVAGLARFVVEQHGTIDAAVSYAGYTDPLSIRELTPERLLPMVDVQLVGALYFLRHIGNAMATSGGGSLINISSTTAHRPTAMHIAYASCKAGVEYATKVAALDYGPDQVRVNCIAPHLIETEMTKAAFTMKLTPEAVRQQTPLGRMGTPDDVANCAVFLASDEANYISGQIVLVDGANSTQKLPTARDKEQLGQLRPDLLE